MKSTNIFLNSNLFFNYAVWKDYYGCYLFPTIIFDKNLPISPLSKITRISFYFLKHRFCIDIGTVLQPKEYTWDNAEMNLFLSWWRKEIKKPITKEKIEEFLDENNYIKKLLTVNTAQHYYVKRFIFKSYANNVKRS